MGFLELQQEPGVYSRVTVRMSIRNSSMFVEVRNLSWYEGQLRNIADLLMFAVVLIILTQTK